MTVVALFVAVAPALAQPALPDQRRIVRLEQWLSAVFEHEPGEVDRPASFVALWPGRDLESLLFDAGSLAHLMLNPKTSRFAFREPGAQPVEIRYTTAQVSRMRTLAAALRCGASPLGDPLCLEAARLAKDDAGLARLMAAVGTASNRDGDNTFLKRGALLHTDIEILVPPSDRGSDDRAAAAQDVRIQFDDGQQRALTVTSLHWRIARMLLDAVRPDGAARPAPKQDAMVLRWYQATAAWLQAETEYNSEHLEHARRIFQDDPTLMFLSGTHHEAWAGAEVQAMIRGAALPSGITVAIGSSRAEARKAEGYFRRALELAPDFTEARLRLGHTLLMLERHDEAAVELRRILDPAGEPLIQFYVTMFLGAADEGGGRPDAAVESYTRAAELYPTAQSPRIALSALARRRGNRERAWQAMEAAFALPASQSDRDDPWWTYIRQQGRDAEFLLRELRRPFEREAPR